MANPVIPVEFITETLRVSRLKSVAIGVGVGVGKVAEARVVAGLVLKEEPGLLNKELPGSVVSTVFWGGKLESLFWFSGSLFKTGAGWVTI